MKNCRSILPAQDQTKSILKPCHVGNSPMRPMAQIGAKQALTLRSASTVSFGATMRAIIC